MGGPSTQDAATLGIVAEGGLASSPSAETPPPVFAFDSSSAHYGFDDVSAGDDEEAARPASTGSSAWREEWEESEARAAPRPSEESSRSVTQSPVAVGEADSEPAADVQSDLAAESYSLVSAEIVSRVRDETIWEEQKKSSESLMYKALRGEELA